MGQFALLDQRGLLAVSGPERIDFLQGLISNDMGRLTAERSLWAALLTPQGRYLHDFFIIQAPSSSPSSSSSSSSPSSSGGAESAEGAETLWLEGAADRLPDLKKRLTMYRLRAKVSLGGPLDGASVAVVWGEGIATALGFDAGAAEPGATRPFGAQGLAFLDPRHPQAGARVLLPSGGSAAATAALEAAGLTPDTAEAWDRHRLFLGLPDGARDMAIDKALLLENGFDELGGVDWKKGCYVGQELTARTKYRGLIKKRLLPVSCAGPCPAPGTPIRQEDRDVGEMRSSVAGIGLALLRLEALMQAAPLQAGEAVLTVRLPDWVRLPEEA